MFLSQNKDFGGHETDLEMSPRPLEPSGVSEMDSYLNFLQNGGTESSGAHFLVRFMAIFVFHELGLFLCRGVQKYVIICLIIFFILAVWGGQVGGSGPH